MAEELALKHLEQICSEIKELYPPGARITICSDGRVFSDLVGVSDQDVTNYGRGIHSLCKRIGATALDIFHMEDLFELDDHATMREQLRLHYAETIEAIEERVQTYEHHQTLFNGIQRFLFEDRLAIETEKSRTQIRNECKQRTYQVIQRSDAGFLCAFHQSKIIRPQRLTSITITGQAFRAFPNNILEEARRAGWKKEWVRRWRLVGNVRV